MPLLHLLRQNPVIAAVKDNASLDRLPKVIYFTDSFLALHIDRKGNAFYCIML